MAAEISSNRCPNCGKAVAVGSLAFSNALGAFVCPECRGESPPPPATQSRTSTSKLRRPLITAIIVGLCVIGVAIAWVARGPSKGDKQQRVWDEAHHAEIIALKSEAEGLAIQGKLAEAHAKYREIEKIIGGRQVKEPSLFDMVEVARQDQDRIYKMLLQRMDQGPGGATARPTSPATLTATPPSVNLPNGPMPVTPRPGANEIPGLPQQPQQQQQQQPPQQQQQT